jgi:formylglycine-generating enzyme required for sulfatase activity
MIRNILALVNISVVLALLLPGGGFRGGFSKLAGSDFSVQASQVGIAEEASGSTIYIPLIVKAPHESGAFSKLSPSNGATNQPTSLTLYWSDSSGASDYEYCYDTTDDNTCTIWVSTGTSSQATIGGLAYSTTYYWQVRATNEGGTTYASGSATSYWRFTTGVFPKEMIDIPAGEFQMGCDPVHNGGYSCSEFIDQAHELPLHSVHLDAYRIDKHEVTNAEYAQCAAAGECTEPVESKSQTRPSYYGNPAYADYPVVYVTWFNARDYCAWAGKRLPTEAEWEKAARGPTLRAFPWGGGAANCGLANYSGCVGDTSQVGSYPAGASPYGVMDMASNVWEWVNDWYSSTYYNESPDSNPFGPASGTLKVFRGGSWASDDYSLRVANRNRFGRGNTSSGIGFRCAAFPENHPGTFGKKSPIYAGTNQLTTLILSWEASSGAASYEFCYDTTDDNACSDWISTGRETKATISGLAENTTYYWQVRATNAWGTTYADWWDATWSFTTGSGGVYPGEMITIPAGEFQMGCHPDHMGGLPCFDDELPLHTVYLDAFRIDKHEVTVAEYGQCVLAGGCAAPSSTSSATRGSYFGNPAYADYPVINVSWLNASDYCAWAGKRLPTEAEWEKAARGPTLRAFPWGGGAANCSLANYSGCVGDTSQKGYYPSGASPYGVMDMAGNVWEWVKDWYSSTYYSTSPYSNPPGPESGTLKVLRGGSWDYGADFMLVASRAMFSSPTHRDIDIGFRCAAWP